MCLPLSSAVASRLEKAAVDNGFDRELPAVGEWLAFASTQSPLCIWLGMTAGGAAAIALSRHSVAGALGPLGEPLQEKQFPPCHLLDFLGQPPRRLILKPSLCLRAGEPAYQRARP